MLEASRGGEAMRLVERHDGPIDLVITGVVMPGASGPDLVERLARIRPEIPFLYVTGYAEGVIVPETLSHSKIALLEKPFTAHALARRVREVLDQQRRT